jgi:hypothetical protein
MGRAKNLVQKIAILRMLFQLQQPFFHNSQMLRDFIEERVLKLRKIVTHRTLERSFVSLVSGFVFFASTALYAKAETRTFLDALIMPATPWRWFSARPLD